MKHKIHRSQVVITSLAVLIAVAGYITYEKKDELFKNKQVQTSAENPTEVLSSEIDLNPGEVLLTGNIVSNADYAADMKMSRQTMRSKNQESLLEIVNNKNISDEQKQNAIDEMVKITQTAEKENNAEIMLEAKGFKNVVVSISEKYCDVVCDMGEVTEEKRAQIEDIVVRKTGCISVLQKSAISLYSLRRQVDGFIII